MLQPRQRSLLKNGFVQSCQADPKQPREEGVRRGAGRVCSAAGTVTIQTTTGLVSDRESEV